MRRIIAVLDEDTGYASGLADYINGNDLSGMKTVAFSDLKTLKRALSDYDIQVLLLSESMEKEVRENLVQPESAGIRVILSEDGFIGNDGCRDGIFKYQPADRIAREVMRIYSDMGSRNITKLSGDAARIYGVYSPVNRCGKTAFAITLGMYLASSAGTLLIELDEYSGVFGIIAAEAVSDLSDVIYAYRQNSCTWSRIRKCVYQFGRLSYIPPVRYAGDLAELNIEDLKNMISGIANEGGFENIVIDFGSFGRQAVDLVELCTQLFVPVINEKSQQCKVGEFREQLDASGQEDMQDRIRELTLPEPDKKKELQTNEEDYSHGKLYDYTRDLFEAAKRTDAGAE